MNSLLQLLDILTALLGRWLKQERAREAQESYDQNHSDPQGRFAARFGAASGQLPDGAKPTGELPATNSQADMEPRQ
ncbi:hypothetical protein LA366_02630 [Aeromonas jandaei]|uniref:Uncharacterized protein n=1 Tax=Aeromonas jandaei TaxID=650 RepID=A0A7T4A8M0_AERJA|nr:hypothetical protein [Aeromonas jandaei]QQB19330.1 hypothetical protein I6H43_17685 [Aeromonas jandaei]UCA34004.1 hypothetical protein LA366_02630 [Aeromonas jandaei]